MKKRIPPLNAAKALFIRRYYIEKAKRQKAIVDYNTFLEIDQFQREMEIDKLIDMIQEKYKDVY
jgi:hypothetical protein